MSKDLRTAINQAFHREAASRGLFRKFGVGLLVGGAVLMTSGTALSAEVYPNEIVLPAVQGAEVDAVGLEIPEDKQVTTADKKTIHIVGNNKSEPGFEYGLVVYNEKKFVNAGIDVGVNIDLTQKTNPSKKYGVLAIDGNLTLQKNLDVKIINGEGDGTGVYIDGASKMSVAGNTTVDVNAAKGVGFWIMNTTDEALPLNGEETDSSNIHQFQNVDINVVGDSDATGISIYGSQIHIAGDLTISTLYSGEREAMLLNSSDSSCGIYNEYGDMVIDGNTTIVAETKVGSGMAILNGGNLEFRGLKNHFVGDIVNSGSISFGRDDARSFTLVEGEIYPQWLADPATIQPYARFDSIDVINGVLQVTGNYTSSITKLDHSTLILGGEKNILLRKLTYSGRSELLLNSPESLLILGQSNLPETPDAQLILGGTGYLNDRIDGDLNVVKEQFKLPEPQNYDFILHEGEVVGEVTFDANGKMVEKVNVKNQAKVDRLANLTTAVTRVELNDLRKRLGDVRMAGEATGAWARYNGGAFSGGNGFDADFNMIQVGGDTALPGNWRVGGAFTYSRMESDDNLGSADADTFSLAGYGVWQGDNGLFADTIARVAKVSTDMKDVSGSADVDSWLVSLSGEVGMRYDFGGQFFVEPAAELTYTYIDGDSFTIGEVEREIDSADSLIARVGATVGMALPQNKGDVYFRAGVANECLGDFDMTSRLGEVSRTVNASVDDTWFEFAVGGNVNLNKNTYLYADLERTEGGDLDEDWRANLGVRYSF